MQLNEKVKIGIVGGGFGSSFYFHLHPNCHVEAVSATTSSDQMKLQQTYSCSKSYESLSELLKDPQIDAVALFTPAHLHAQHAIEALQHGKSVLCAVPVGLTLDECSRVKLEAKRSGKLYMMAETTVYRQDTISARKFYINQEFGKLIGAEATYHHPGLEEYFFDDHGKPTWRHGLPPMLYATHCMAFLTAVSGERMRSVSCLGWSNQNAQLQGNIYNNPFWNQTALFQTELETPYTVNISWKGALMPTERCEWHGEKMSFYSNDPKSKKAYIVHRSDRNGYDDGGFMNYEPVVQEYQQPDWWDSELLPKSLRIRSGHFGSHTFLTHEFIDSIISNRKSEVDIERAIDLTIPGIIAHESSLKKGEQLIIPHYAEL